MMIRQKRIQCSLGRISALFQHIYGLTESWRGALAREAGFTYMELITAVAVLGITSAIAIPTFNSYIPRARLNGACRDLMSNMQLARLRAISTNFNAYLDFDHNNNQRTDERFYTAFLNLDRDSPIEHDTPAETEAVNIIMPDRLDSIRGILLPPGVRFGTGEDVPSGPNGSTLPSTGVSIFGGGFRVNFTSRGTATPASAYFTNGTDTCAIRVASTGRVKMFQWISSEWR
ncbi:MAG: hypothetical protein HY731_01945 [Candidatus Tectomicrobia bacterium]|nr:hypothetical protein [Candidatus Tectomicrobia bacterium]